MNTVEDIRRNFRKLLLDEEYVQDKTGVKTLELISAQFIADEPCIFGSYNEEYVEKEMKWYKSMSLNVYDIEPPVPAIWKQVADSNGFINSNYGWCIWSDENYNQYEHCLNELKNNRDSRRAVIIYIRPSIWKDFDVDGRSDFMCTTTTQYMIRNNKLICIVNMRSNDVVFGYRNDRAWQKYVHEELAKELDIKCGDIIWNANSLHVYERHFDLVQ